MFSYFSLKAVAQVTALLFSFSLAYADLAETTDSKEKGTLPPNAQKAPLPKPDPVRSVREKAQSGDREAQFDYGCRLLYGHGGATQDILLGTEYLNKAADAGQAKAASVLGYEYQTGRTLEKDVRKALQYYEKAAKLGDAASVYELGRLYANGSSALPADGKKSFHYYELALPLLEKEAEQELTAPYIKGKSLVSCITLGNMYLNGQGTSINQEKAFDWYLKAATKGDPVAQVQVGHCYMNGTGTPRNAGEAKKWFSLSNSNGNPKTALSLAMLTLQSEGKSAAEKEFDAVAEQGDARMKAAIGSIYRTIYQNPVKAFIWTRQAAEQGDADAECALGVAYWKAEGTEWNPIQAIKWLKKAASAGQKDASRNLSTIIQYLSAAAVITLGVLGGILFLIYKRKKGRREEDATPDQKK